VTTRDYSVDAEWEREERGRVSMGFARLPGLVASV